MTREQWGVACHVSPFLQAPGPEAWKQLLGGDPLVRRMKIISNFYFHINAGSVGITFL
jgi:hypothetical protein